MKPELPEELTRRVSVVVESCSDKSSLCLIRSSKEKGGL